VLAPFIFDFEVRNGGLDQFYSNNKDKYIDSAIAGLKLFATKDFMDIAVKSKEIYIRDKDLFVGMRNPSFDSLDDKYYELEYYRKSKVEFIKSNLDKIVF
jgi:hypothetical protein